MASDTAFTAQASAISASIHNIQTDEPSITYVQLESRLGCTAMPHCHPSRARAALFSLSTPSPSHFLRHRPTTMHAPSARGSRLNGLERHVNVQMHAWSFRPSRLHARHRSRAATGRVRADPFSANSGMAIEMQRRISKRNQNSDAPRCNCSASRDLPNQSRQASGTSQTS